MTNLFSFLFHIFIALTDVTVPYTVEFVFAVILLLSISHLYVRTMSILCRWDDISIDLNSGNPDYYDVRRLWKGQQKRSKTGGGNLHCIMAFEKSVRNLLFELSQLIESNVCVVCIYKDKIQCKPHPVPSCAPNGVWMTIWLVFA